jgi:ABC-type multidrug transport system ATPase subunit
MSRHPPPEPPPTGALAFQLRAVRSERGNGLVLRGVDADIPAGRVTALVGASGSGKSSLLRLLNRLDEATGGSILYRARPLAEYPVRELRRKVGFVFQAPVMFAGTLRDNLHIAAELAGLRVDDADSAVADALAAAELDPALADRPGDQLSGGEAQRANIARALVCTPDVLLMDEPTSALDPDVAERLMDTIVRMSRERGLTVVVATHRLEEARQSSDYTIAMEEGRIRAAGPPDAVLARTDARTGEGRP